jgi:hypothetical protein
MILMKHDVVLMLESIGYNNLAAFLSQPENLCILVGTELFQKD